MIKHATHLALTLLVAVAPLAAQESPERTAARTAIRDAKDVVHAIYAFHTDCGLWPQQLADLVPRYVAAIPNGWNYNWSYEGYVTLSRTVGQPKSNGVISRLLGGRDEQDHSSNEIILVLNGDEAGWYTGTYGSYEWMDEAIPAPWSPPYSRDLVRNAAAEFDRRFQRDHDPTHLQAKATYLFEMNALREAETAALDWVERMPKNWTPRAVLADIEMYRRFGIPQQMNRSGDAERARYDYRDACGASAASSYAIWRILHQPSGDTGSSDGMPKMIELPIYNTRTEWLIVEPLLHNDAAWLVMTDMDKLLLKVCARWEAAAATIDDCPTDSSYLVYRANALLQLGQFDRAAEVYAEAQTAAKEGWVACGDFSELGAAIARRDRDYEFQPEDEPHRGWRMRLNCPPPRP